MATVGVVLFVFALVVGLISIPLGMPGTAIMAAAAVLYGLLTHFSSVTLPLALAMVAIAVLAEVLEFTMGLAGAQRLEASRRGMVGSIVGGLVGGILGAGLFLGLGAVPGVLAGTFVGAFAAELTRDLHPRKAARAARGALVGRATGMAIKLILAIVMLVLLLQRVL